MNQATKKDIKPAPARPQGGGPDVRYEILSSVASSDHGLKEYPVLRDLADSLTMAGATTRIVRQIARQEGEVNVANQQFAKGVNVRQKTVKNLPPQTTLMGCLSWMRAVTSRMDRGLHLHVDSVRNTNGTGLVLGQVFHRGARGFISGVEEGNWERLIAKIDFSLKEIALELRTAKEAKAEYGARAGRASSFMTTLQAMERLTFLPEEFRVRALAMVKKRDKEAVARLTEGEFINLGLLSDLMERYQRLLEEFFEILEKGDPGTDLPAVFAMMVQGISFDELREQMTPFLIDNRKEATGDVRTLAHSLRISVSRAELPEKAKFREKFTSIFLAARAKQDPKLYSQMMRLEAVQAVDEEVIVGNRQHFQMVDIRVRAAKPGEQPPDSPANREVLEGLFELIVSLTYQGDFNLPGAREVQPKAQLARMLLACCVFRQFDVTSIRSLNKKIPARGVAKDLARKTQVTNGEVVKIMDNLRLAMFPYLEKATEVAAVIRSRYQNQAAQARSKQIQIYLTGALSLIRQSNYVVGTNGEDNLVRGLAVDAGRRLGLGMLVSMDQVRNPALMDDIRNSKIDSVEGYVKLLAKEGQKFFPLRTDGALLGRAFRGVFAEQVIHLVRRFLANRSNHLYQVYKTRLFEVIFQHVVWDHQLSLSRYQLGMILFRYKALDQARLKDFGFIAGGLENGDDYDNPWLRMKEDIPGEAPVGESFDSKKVTEAYVSLRKQMAAFQEKVGKTVAVGAQGEPLGKVLSGFISSGQGNFSEPRCRAELEKTDGAINLWEAIQQIVGANFQGIVTEENEGQAIEFILPGKLAYLSVLKASHQFTISGKEVLFHLKGARDLELERLEGAQKLVAQQLIELVNKGEAVGQRLAAATAMLGEFFDLHGKLVQVVGVGLIDEILQETIYKIVRPAPPMPSHIQKLPPEKVLCLGPSSSDMGRFAKLVPNIDRGGAYATLSQMANWMMRFPRLRKEMEQFRDIISDILDIVAGFNVSTFDAPYLFRYTSNLKKLDEVLAIPPEYLSLEDLGKMQSIARGMVGDVKEIYEKESEVAMRDRWFSRVALALKQRRPGVDLSFFNVLYDRNSQPTAEGEEAVPTATSREGHQTFSERVRNVVESSAQLRTRRVFVVSPTATQGKLTLSLIDQIYRVKGLFVPVLADISNAGNLPEELLQRIPPHRLFNINNL